MITQIAHVCIGAKDLQESEHFYCKVLGLSKKFDFRKAGELFGFYLDVGNNTFIEVFPETAEVAVEKTIIRHLCLEVDDLAALIVRVKEHDWEISEKKMGADHSWQAWITDPSGVKIEFHQYTPESLQILGTTCEVNW